MTINQMIYFHTVCQTMNLTRAAEKLHMSQPALSAVIKQIENECGVALFRHRANSIAITDEGIVLQQEVEPIIRQAQHLEELIAGHRLDRNYVRVGLSTIRGNMVMPDLVEGFRRKHPEIQLIISEGGTQFHYENLDMNKVDVIITDKKPGFSQEDWDNSTLYGRVRLKEQRMLFAVSRDHPLAERGEVTWEEIVQEPLILMGEPYNQMRNIAERMAKDGYKLPENTYYTSQVYTIVRFVEKNVTAGFLPMDVVQSNPLIRGLTFPGSVPHTIYAVWRKDRRLFRATELLIDVAKAFSRGDDTHP